MCVRAMHVVTSLELSLASLFSILTCTILCVCVFFPLPTFPEFDLLESKKGVGSLPPERISVGKERISVCFLLLLV